MKTLKVSEFRKDIARHLKDANHEAIAIIRHGMPIAVVTGTKKPRGKKR